MRTKRKLSILTKTLYYLTPLLAGKDSQVAEMNENKALMTVGLARQLQASAAAAILKYQKHVAPQVAQLKRMRHVHVSTPVAELPNDATEVFGDKCVS